jgi:hypothetical protein
MGIFGKKKKPVASKQPATPSGVDDVQYWETIAYGWICDAEGVEARERAWARFVQAYPEHAAEICEDFWRRIHASEWYHKHHHKHHHNPYS